MSKDILVDNFGRINGMVGWRSGVPQLPFDSEVTESSSDSTTYLCYYDSSQKKCPIIRVVVSKSGGVTTTRIEVAYDNWANRASADYHEPNRTFTIED